MNKGSLLRAAKVLDNDPDLKKKFFVAVKLMRYPQFKIAFEKMQRSGYSPEKLDKLLDEFKYLIK